MSILFDWDFSKGEIPFGSGVSVEEDCCCWPNMEREEEGVVVHDFVELV